MNTLGFGITNVKIEQLFVDLLNQKLNEFAQPKGRLANIVGSKREGMSLSDKYGDNDNDIINKKDYIWKDAFPKIHYLGNHEYKIALFTTNIVNSFVHLKNKTHLH